MEFSFAIVSALLLFFITNYAWRLARNVSAAKATGLPFLIYPIDPSNIIWLLTTVPLRPWLRSILPTRIWNRLTLTIYGWDFYEKRRPFDEYAAPQGNPKSFLVASCGPLELWTADPIVATDVLRRTDDFKMPPLVGVLLGQFGHNVLTTNGQRWAKQRKVVASVINERISRTIFDAAICQTTGMLDELQVSSTETEVERRYIETTKMFDMIKRITIHVLSEAGMGAKTPWNGKDDKKSESGFKMTYIEACKIVMESVTGPIVIPTGILLNWPSWIPGHTFMKQLGIAKREFPMHTEILLDQERQRMSGKDAASEKSNIMSHLLQASDEQTSELTSLSKDELNGNLFLFTAAGFETTANTLSYAIVLLARYPRWQEWLFEEVDALLTTDASETPEYSAVFPQASRLMSVMLETLRLYTPVVHVLRTNDTIQEIRTSKGIIALPANSSVIINHIALHLDPEVWPNINRGSDPSWVNSNDEGIPDETIFRPSRWINPVGSPRRIYQPPKGCFLPWGQGPRICPGQKMGQVEFVAVMLKLLQQHRIDAVPLTGENSRDVEQRLDELLRNSIPKMTLIMDGIYNVGTTGGVRMRLTRRK